LPDFAGKSQAWLGEQKQRKAPKPTHARITEAKCVPRSDNNEHGYFGKSASIPNDEQLVAYGAWLTFMRRKFEREALAGQAADVR
jgi:hypothetical protein